MPRYVNIPDITFVTADGSKVKVKDIRPRQSYITAFTLPLKGEPTLDEIASRDLIYKADNESLSFILYEANEVEIWENRRIIRGLRSLKIAPSEQA